MADTLGMSPLGPNSLFFLPKKIAMVASSTRLLAREKLPVGSTAPLPSMRLTITPAPNWINSLMVNIMEVWE